MRCFIVGCVVAAAAVVASGQEARPRVGEAKSTPLRGDVHFIADGPPFRSFQELCAKSDAIVDGVLETSAARMINGRVETDQWIRVTRVMRGPAEMPKIVVAEDGGRFGDLNMIGNFPLMQRDVRYVLILWKDNRALVPAIAGVPRYRISDIAAAKYPVVEGKIRLAEGAGLAKYDGIPVDAFVAELNDLLKK